MVLAVAEAWTRQSPFHFGVFFPLFITLQHHASRTRHTSHPGSQVCSSMIRFRPSLSLSLSPTRKFPFLVPVLRMPGLQLQDQMQDRHIEKRRREDVLSLFPTFLLRSQQTHHFLSLLPTNRYLLFLSPFCRFPLPGLQRLALLDSCLDKDSIWSPLTVNPDTRTGQERGASLYPDSQFCHIHNLGPWCC